MHLDAGRAATPSDVADRRGAPVVGATLLALAAVSVYVLRVGGVCCGGRVNRDLYDYGTWLLVVGLAVAGVVLLLAGTPSLRTPAAAVGGVLAAQLAGTGVVAVKRWVPVGGFGPGTWDNAVQLHLVSGLLALCGLGAVLACVVSLRDDRALPAPVSPLARGVAVGAGLLVVVALPVVVAGGRSDVLDVTSLGAHALVYSLPLGVSLAITGWLNRPAAIAAAAGVLLSSLVFLDPNRPLVETPAPSSGLGLVLGAATLVLLTRLLVRGQPTTAP